MHGQYFVYIMANKSNSVLYTGVTNDLARRVCEHRMKATPGFTTRYNVSKLVYYEVHNEPLLAIARDKQIKAGSRKKKLRLINATNPSWKDLMPG